MKMVFKLKESCSGFSLQTGTLIIGSLSMAANVHVFAFGLEKGYLFNLLLTIPMIICSALVLVVAVQNRLPKLLIPWIVLGVFELILVLFGCYLAMVTISAEYQTKSVEKFFFVSFALIAFTAVLLFHAWFVVFSYYRELMEEPKKCPQPEDLPLYYYGLFNLKTVTVTP